MNQPFLSDVKSCLPEDDFSRLDEAMNEFADLKWGARSAGKLIRSAWQAETRLTTAVAERYSGVLSEVLGGRGEQFTNSVHCCPFHRNAADKTARVIARAPGMLSGSLYDVLHLMWIVVPELHATIPCRETDEATPSTVRVSRFMPFETFWANYTSRGLLLDEFKQRFSADQDPLVRQAAVRKYRDRRDLFGLIGSYKQADNKSFCRDIHAFCTPTEEIQADRRTDPPDCTLLRVGLPFEADTTYVEMTYDVSVATVPHDPSPTQSNRYEVAVPTVLDAAGNWLYRPDNFLDQLGWRWNRARNLLDDGSGAKEIIHGTLPMDEVVDVIIWSVPTSTRWSDRAQPCYFS